jgi:hypothetical protein
MRLPCPVLFAAIVPPNFIHLAAFSEVPTSNYDAKAAAREPTGQLNRI